MKSIILIFAICFAANINAQTISKATSQAWAGGACCSSGVDYIVTLEFDLPPKTIEVTKVYLAGHGELSGRITPHSDGNVHKTMQVSFGISHNHRPDLIDYNYDKKIIKDVYSPEFIGEALIVLQINGKTVEVIVEEFEELMSIAYP